MKSEVTDEFRACLARLPARIRRLAQKNYRLWAKNPDHPSLDFKQVSRRTATFSVRVGIGWRALGVLDDDTIIWFWIGSHAEYDALLRRRQ